MMIFRIVSLWLLWFAVGSGALAEVDPHAERAAQLESLSRAQARIESLKSSAAALAMPKLGEILTKTARQSIYQVEQRWEVHRQAKEAILVMPGYAKYFADTLKELKLTLRDQGNKNDYDRERVQCFEVMSFLPSPEIVETLGNLLPDDEDEPGPWKENQDYAENPANSRMAAITLGQLLEKPPTKAPPLTYSKDDVETWKLWFAQVKAGTKGFQFKGSDTVHYLATPATDKRRPAVAEPGPPVSENRTPRPENRDAPKNEPQKFPLIATLIALGLLALALAWFVISKRNATTGS